MIRSTRTSAHLLVSLTLVGLFSGPTQAAVKKTLTFEDLMAFRQIESPSISRNGTWISYELKPDRGDGLVIARQVDTDSEYTVTQGSDPILSGDSRWLASTLLPTQRERDLALDQKDEKRPKNGMSLLSLETGHEIRIDRVESFAFSEDGHWLVWKQFEPLEDSESETDNEGTPDDPPVVETTATAVVPSATEVAETVEEVEHSSKAKSEDDRPTGTVLVLKHLETGRDITIAHVESFAFDEGSRYLAYTVAAPMGEGNGVFIRRLDTNAVDEQDLLLEKASRNTHLAWAEESSRLAFLSAVDDEDFDPGPADLWFWDGESSGEAVRIASSSEAPQGWRIPSKNSLEFSRDGTRLFLGYEWIDPTREAKRLKSKEQAREKRHREKAEKAGEAEVDLDFNPYDFEVLLERTELDVWHGDDARINPNQKKEWERSEKDRTYLAVVHLASGKIVQLADREVPDVSVEDNALGLLGTSALPYLKLLTWDGTYQDVYHIDLNTGGRTLVVERLRDPDLSLSPDGRYVVYWNDLDWFLFDSTTGTTRNLTEGLEVPFENEDHDYPRPVASYGVADWIEGDRAVLIYDKFDLWSFPTDGGVALNLTGGKGRAHNRTYRILNLDPESESLAIDAKLILRSYHEVQKNFGFWQTKADREALTRLTEQDAMFRYVAKAEEADRLLYTRETFLEFPDLWISDLELGSPQRLSLANPQIDQFAWGTPELVEWTSSGGIPLQGVLIKPANYVSGQRYPVLVYFYRFMSQRLYSFNEPVVNHRPSLSTYASQGYAVFLPDVRFEIGRPGASAVKALVPGVQKLVDMGVADPNAIGLHGHSWSGYQTAHVITQTNLFTAAVAGAPVSNMTSAYSGIRLGSGLARQFQYEQTQSRIGASLDADLPKYIENSPVFHARHIETPLLIQFGDEDGAVPWEQGIELYLAMRRLDKDVIFLQYRGEPHHLKKYANKLDYSIKMMQFFDHHLKGKPAPDWMTEGVPYRGD